MDQVRWKKARPGLAAEIRTHLLDRVHRPRPQWGLLVFALALAALGTLVRLVLTMNTPIETPLVHIMGGVLGAVCLAVGYLLDVSALGRRAGCVCLGFLAVTIPCAISIPSVISMLNSMNLTGWIIGSFLIQTLFPLTLALLLWRLRGWLGALGALAWTALCGALCLLMPSLFAFLQVTLSALVLGLFFARQNWFGIGKWLVTILVALLGLGVLLLIVYYGYWPRFRFDIHPELDPLDQGYHATAIRTALSGARWLGPADPSLWLEERGRSLVPNIEGDNLLTNLICSWGWLPFLAVVGAFAAFFLWMLWKTLRLRQTLGRAVCLGGLTALGVQAVFSLLLNLGVPLFAASFPLVVGNTGTVLNMFFIGLMLSAFRDGAMPEDRPAERLLTVPAVSWADGVLTVNFKGRTLSE